MLNKPLVSVVIPTYHRPLLVKRATQSALAQTLTDIEVIVVIDGPDAETRAALAQIDDPRLRVIELQTNQGSCATRNAGIEAAQATWVAFLDDDDEWMPQKLQLQLQAAQNSQYQFPVVTCYLRVVTPQGEAIWPRRIPKPGEALSEYLFVRNTVFQGEGLIQTSTIFTAKALLEKIPFLTSVRRHDDWDWLLRVATQPGAGVEFVPEVLSVWYLEKNRPSISRASKWQLSFYWIQANLHLVTPRAYSSFLLAEVGARAARDRAWDAFLPLLWEALRWGKPQPLDICIYCGMWLISPASREWLRNLLTRRRKLEKMNANC